MIVNGKKYKDLKEALPDVKEKFPFVTLERLNNIFAGRTDRLSNEITIKKVEKSKNKLNKLLSKLKEEDPEIYSKVKSILNNIE